MRIGAAKRLDIHKREALPCGPISECRSLTSLRLIKANDAPRQIVFDVEVSQQILANQSGFFAADFASRNHEVNVVKGRSEKRKILDAGEPSFLLAADS